MSNSKQATSLLDEMSNDSNDSTSQAQRLIVQQDMFPETLPQTLGETLMTDTNIPKVITPEEWDKYWSQLQGYEFLTQPYYHQLRAFIESRDREAFALLMEMGTGKTKVAIDTISWLWHKKKINAVLVFGNKGSYRNWVTNEIPIHMPKTVPYFMTYWDAGAKPPLQATYEEMYVPQDPPVLKIFVMNIEALSYDRGIAAAVRFARQYHLMMIIDESTTIKNRGAQRTKNAIKLGTWAEYRRIMTGSPITKQPMDLYCQTEFLDWKFLGFSSYEAFQNRYADLMQKESRGKGGKKFRYTAVIGYKHLDELKEKLKKYSFRVRKDECLDLPPKVYETVEVELTDEQERMYKELLKRSETEVKEGVMASAPLIITRLLRLHQLVCGHIVDEEGNEHAVKNNRLETLMTLLEETDGKVIIWATYRRNIQDIAEAIAKVYGDNSVATYYGGTSSDDRAEALRRFEDLADPLRFMVGNPSVGGYGTTMVAAGTVVYYSNSYDLEKRLQSEDRAHRIGQTKSVTYVDLVTRGTVDEKIITALLNKKGIASQILGDPFNFLSWIKLDSAF